MLVWELRISGVSLAPEINRTKKKPAISKRSLLINGCLITTQPAGLVRWKSSSKSGRQCQIVAPAERNAAITSWEIASSSNQPDYKKYHHLMETGFYSWHSWHKVNNQFASWSELESRYEQRFHLKQPDTELKSINMALSRIFPWHRQTRKDPVRKNIPPRRTQWNLYGFVDFSWALHLESFFFVGLVQPPNNPQNALWSSEAISWRLSSTEPEMQKTTQRMIWLPGTTMPLNQPLSNDLSKALHMAWV